MATPLRSKFCSSLADATVDNAISSRKAENRLFIYKSPRVSRFLKSIHSHQTRQGVRSDTNKKGKELLSPSRSPRIAWGMASRSGWTCQADTWRPSLREELLGGSS